MRRAFEPGTLHIFRWLTALRLGFALLTVLLKVFMPGQRALRYPALTILESAFLLAYLSWPWLQRALGALYLPFGLAVASGGPIVEHAFTVALRLRAGVTPASAAQDVWTLIPILFVPLILIAWEYNIGAVFAFCAATSTLEVLLYLPLALRGRIRYASIFGLVFVRALLFALVGYVVVRLVRAGREQRAALARANRQLAHYATTLEQLTVSRERNRMARELHDTLAHTLSGVAVQLEAVRSLWESDPEAAREMVEQSLASTRAGLGDARRAIHALRAAPLEDLGLALAIRELAQSAAGRAEWALALQVPEDAWELPPAVEQAIYRVADEALANAAQHAGARNARVCLEQKDARITLVVRDDGQGFDPTQPVPEGHYGLQGMRERAEMVGGVLTVDSAPGRGTAVRFEVEVEPNV
ncbi:MAG: sensor histidine kinase [Anaerolineae bacterium]